MNEPKNLDIICAQVGSALADVAGEEKILNEALAVLEEQGPYAMFLYLKARHRKKFDGTKAHFKTLFRESLGDKITNSSDVLDMMVTLAKDLDDLLFARDLLRTALSYARYYLKAKGGDTS